MTNEEKKTCIEMIRSGKAIFLRRLSLMRKVFKCQEGHNVWYVVYDNKHKTIEQQLASEPEASFNLNDPVTWKDDAGQSHRGKIVVIVPPCQQLISKLGAFSKAGYDPALLDTTRAKRYRSYLVSVGTVLHWPHVRNLRRIVNAG